MFVKTQRSSDKAVIVSFYSLTKKKDSLMQLYIYEKIHMLTFLHNFKNTCSKLNETFRRKKKNRRETKFLGQSNYVFCHYNLTEICSVNHKNIVQQRAK